MSNPHLLQTEYHRSSLESIFDEFVASSQKKPWLTMLSDFESNILDELKQLKHACNLLDYAEQRQVRKEAQKELSIC